MPFYDFTREPAREFSLKELVARISELERRRQAEGDESADENGNPWRRRRADREQNASGGESDLLKE